jgi:5-methylcytosine-specific restriction endonuclease McrA
MKRSPHWDEARDEHLKRQPTCQVCGRRAFLNVHHIKPFHLSPELELVQENLITLCEGQSVNCHLLFGHLLNWAKYNPNVVEDAAAWRAKIAKRAG